MLLFASLCDMLCQWILFIWTRYFIHKVGSLLTVFTCATLASAGISHCRVSVCPPVTSRCSTETAKRWIMQTTPHDSPWTLVFWFRKSRQNSNRVTPSWGAKCTWWRFSADAVAANWWLSMWSIVNLVWSKFITLSVHLISLQHVRHDAVCRAGLSVTADCCYPVDATRTCCECLSGELALWTAVSLISAAVYCSSVPPFPETIQSTNAAVTFRLASGTTFRHV